MTSEEFAKYIDHTILKPQATVDDVFSVCDEAIKYSFATVCVNSYFVPFVKKKLKGTSVGAATVVGFPLGASSTAAKCFEAASSILSGANEIDMVINMGLLKMGNIDEAYLDIAAVVEAAHSAKQEVNLKNVIVKVIIETCYLTDGEKKKAAEMVKKAGADFVKTSTGFGPGGAKVEDVALIRKVVGNRFGIKASGGIKTYKQVLSMIEAGATRIGTSSGTKLMEEFLNEGKGI
ncbi:deoxyribose-phosphate aldolase [Candidatus Oleimmundimicrobium sp.]|uniref:deoxyribose-phosphate aldolase n=1 Tax=Candidatus Oleimmundimicrobium sp. TaxID=3060597 RepID=UPI0027184372|nr:deoxyribose-phosphate aldolase [Candidatus Oleimmundimicrobium sp.]MDO8885837.1 deoxyribose-phosphate aldolase [Candidatus Oleimmundimicrobium sp.]